MKAHYGSIRKAEDQSFEQESISTSRFRCLAAQCCGVFASNCLKFTSSTFVGFHIILIAELHKPSAEIPVTLDQLTWLASLNILVPIGSIGNGFITQKIGSRFMMLVSSISFVVIWLTYYNATTITQVMAARILYSLTSGALKTSVGTYITEISEPQLRGCFLATYHLAATFGSFFSLLLGSLIPWRTIAIVNMTFPVISILMVFLIPDSPYWLASKGRLRDAKQSLCWLRGWTKPSGVRTEYRSLVEHFERSSLLHDHPIRPSEMEPVPTPASLNRRERLKAFVRPYLQRSFYLPFGSMTLIYLLYYLSGSTTVQTYSMVIFSKMDSPMDDSVATAWMGAMRVVGAFVVLFSISSTGKRRLLFGSLGLAFVCFLLIGCAELLPANDLNPWLPPLAMILAVFGNASGVDSVIHMLNSEIYPASMRYIGSAIGSSVSSVMGSLMNKFFLYIVEAISLPGVFLLFATMNLVSMVVYNNIVPETEGRSLQEIQDHYGGVKSLDESRAPDDQGVDDASGKTRVTQV